MVYDITDVESLIRSYIVSSMQDKHPDLDTSENSPLDDILIKPMIAIMSKFLDRANKLEMMQNLNNAEYMTEEELDEKGEGSYFLSRKEGEAASTLLTLMFANLNLDDEKFELVIPSGLTFSSPSGATFQTIIETKLYADDVKKGYDKFRMLYEIEVTVKATDIGSKYNVGANEIIDCQTSFSNSYIGCTNKSAVVNGRNSESNTEYAARIRSWYTSRQLGTKPGYTSFLLESFDEIKDVYVVGYRDEFMERDLMKVVGDDDVVREVHVGGKVDIYIRGCEYINQITEITANTNKLILNVPYDKLIDIERIKAYNLSDESKIPVTGTPRKITGEEFDGKYEGLTEIIINNDDEVSYSEESINDMMLNYYRLDDEGNVMPTQNHYFQIGRTESELSTPMVNITNITCTDNVKLPSDLKAIYDLEYFGLRGTTDEKCKVVMKNIDFIPNGANIQVGYILNETLRKCAQTLNDEANRIITADVVVKEATPVYTNIQFEVKLTDNRTVLSFEDIQAKIKASVVNFFNNYRMGDQVEESNLVAWLYQDATVKEFIQYIALPFKVFYVPNDIGEEIPDDGSQHAENGVLPIKAIEYPVLNTPKFEVSVLSI